MLFTSDAFLLWENRDLKTFHNERSTILFSDKQPQRWANSNPPSKYYGVSGPTDFRRADQVPALVPLSLSRERILLGLVRLKEDTVVISPLTC